MRKKLRNFWWTYWPSMVCVALWVCALDWAAASPHGFWARMGQFVLLMIAAHFNVMYERRSGPPW